LLLEPEKLAIVGPQRQQAVGQREGAVAVAGVQS